MRPAGLFCVSVALCMLAVASSSVTSGQTAGSTVMLVPLELRAQKNGAPVFDLRLDEIAVRVGGVEQEVRTLDLIRPDLIPAPVPFATNLATRRGRDLVFVLDEESIQVGGEQRLRDALSAMLPLLTPHDRIGLVSLHPSGATMALTASHAAFRAAIPLVRGRAIGPETATDLFCRTRRRILPTVTTLMKGLDAGVTTTVLLFSAAIAAPAAASVPASGIEVACLLTPEDFTEFRSAAAQSAAEFYAIHVGDASSTQLDATKGAGLERLAGEAGGRFLRISGDASPAMKRIASDTLGFHVVTIALDSGWRQRPRRPVELRIRRDGVTARSRPELALLPMESKTVSPRDMLHAATGFRDLPLRVASFSSRDSGSRVKVVALFEPSEPAVILTTAVAGLFGEQGQLVAQWTGEREELTVRPVVAGLVAPPGKYRLRVATVDSRGRSGAVDEDLIVALSAAGSATMSSVVLGAPRQSGFVPKLQFTAADSAAAAYVEVYGISPCSALSATIEIAQSEQGPSLAKAPATATTVDQSDACIVFGGVDISALPPGDYVMRIELQRNGEPLGRRIRILRKVRF